MPDRASTSPMVPSVSGPPGFSIDPRHEEAHWRVFHARQPYCRADLDFEDYAPAYCVGYVGCAQYGGHYADAETSLCANWVRIKGDSRLSLDEARCAIRAAWERVAACVAEQLTWPVDAGRVAAAPSERPAAQPAHHVPADVPAAHAARERDMAST